MPAPSTRSVVGPLYGAGGALLTSYTLVFRRSGDLQQVDGEAVAPTFTPSAYVQQVVTDGTTADFAVTLVLGRYDLQFTAPTGAYGTIKISVGAGAGSLPLADTLDGPAEEAANTLSQAIAARDLAQAWAANPENDTVPGGGGLFSSLHYAAKSAEERIASAASATSSAASAAAAGVASGRFVITAFSELATKFVAASPAEGQQILPVGGVVVDEKTGNRWERVSSGGQLDYTGTGGVIFGIPTDQVITPGHFGIAMTGAGECTAEIGRAHV